jgi:hypothetical protein
VGAGSTITPALHPRILQPLNTGDIRMATETMTQRDHAEGTVARSIEQQTAKLPSDTFLWAAVGAMGTSLTLQMMGKQHASQFVGQWAPTLLILGLYNKLVKQLGSDGERARASAL